ncbi:mutator type transposase [Tanacetum coccineum]
MLRKNNKNVQENICLLGAMERGFKEGGRELLGLNGAFTRGQYPRLMLIIVGVDANNGRADCDVLIKNLCEVFNRQLLDAKNSLIITALEFVREYLMKRIVIVQKVIQKCDGPLTPVVTKLFNKIKEASSECTVYWNVSNLFQVKGIPCKHAIAVIHDMADNDMDLGTPEDWVHESYKLQTWMNVYSHKVNPMNGKDIWTEFECVTTLLPPKVDLQIGRPPKKRKKNKGTGHNKRGCKATGSSDGGQINAMPSETVPTQHVASQPRASQTMVNNVVERKPMARRLVQKKSVRNKRATNLTSNAANQAATQGSHAATQG